MRSTTGNFPRFGPYALVCTALRREAEQGLTHQLIIHTTLPCPVRIRYHFRPLGRGPTSRKAV